MVTHAQAEAFLVERFGAGVRAVCSVGHGEWSQAFTYACGGEAGGQYVVRFSPFEEDFRHTKLLTHREPDPAEPTVDYW